MKKYRYIEFVDGTSNSPVSKLGHVYIVAEKPECYVEEFSLVKAAGGYYTTLEKIGEMGWELAFVTPCGYFRTDDGTIKNAYVFKKEKE